MIPLRWPYCSYIFIINFIFVHSSGLYNSTDNVTIFNGNNLLPILESSSNLWLVEYYLEWCGHCQRFAPTYQALARDVAEWYPVISLGVLNCAVKENVHTCRQRNIDGYPTLRFHKPYSNSSETGEKFQVEYNLKYLRNGIVDFVEENLALIEWDYEDILKPNFQPLTSSDALSFTTPTTMPERVAYVVIVFEDSKSMMGREIILDMSSCSNIIVRRVLTDTKEGSATALKLSGASDSLNVVVASRNGSITTVIVALKTRHFYSYKLKKLPGVGDPAAHTLVIPENLPHEPRNIAIDPGKIDRNIVYLADLESALRYMLTVESTATKILEGAKLETLKKLIELLVKVSSYFPARSFTINFLSSLNDWIHPLAYVSADDWLERIEEKKNNSYLPSTSRLWVGCSSSISSLRGYPCSLWTFFHTLSVAAYNAKINKPTLPEVMHAYIANFFGCRECRNNFEKEIKDIPYHSTSGSYDSIMWLWKIHNKVNDRLHKDPSKEDPEFPKLQFPTTNLCQNCRYPSNGWNETAVIEYLIHRHSKQHISVEYIDDVIMLDGVISDKSFTKSNATGLVFTRVANQSIVNGSSNGIIHTEQYSNSSDLSWHKGNTSLTEDNLLGESEDTIDLITYETLHVTLHSSWPGAPVDVTAVDVKKDGMLSIDTINIISQSAKYLNDDAKEDEFTSSNKKQVENIELWPSNHQVMKSKYGKSSTISPSLHVPDQIRKPHFKSPEEEKSTKEDSKVKELPSLNSANGDLLVVVNHKDREDILRDVVLLSHHSSELKDENLKKKNSDEIWRKRLEHAFNKPLDNKGGEGERLNDDVIEAEYQFHPRALRSKKHFSTSRLFDLGFTSMDFNLCLFLWTLSFLLIILLLVGFRSKRRWLNRKFKHDRHLL